MNARFILERVLSIIAALIMLQTLYFKFSGAEESIYIFSTLGMEPWGRIGTGVAELIAGILLIYPRTTHFGALMGVGIMAGAIVSHLTTLGIEVQSDGGYLFALAMVVFVCCDLLVALNLKKFIALVKKEN
ncbi:MAG: DoxX family protein [bacterium]|nr:DoxX family protein [bacterium]